MRYTTFEKLAAVFGTIAILGTIAAGMTSGLPFPEIVAQFLLLPIMLAALHFGRNGGFLAALFGIAVYVGMRIPDLGATGLEAPLTTLIAERALAYIVIGVFGGEVCSRIKYVFLRLEQPSLIDEETGIYGSTHLGTLLKKLIEQHRRYGVRFGACLITLDSQIVPLGAPRKGKPLVREIAGTLRSDVRAVDEVGRFSAHTFMVLFPSTPKSGVEVALGRLLAALGALLARREIEPASSALSAEMLGYPEDAGRLIALTEELTGESLESASQSGPDAPPVTASA